MERRRWQVNQARGIAKESEISFSQRTRIAATVAAGSLLLFGLLALLYQPAPLTRANGGTLYVATDGDDVHDCATIANRCRTVQRAVDLANAGSTIKVATGVYTDSDTASAGYVVEVTRSVALRGGYDASFADPPHPAVQETILHAEGKGGVVHIDGAAPTIEGFTITGGYRAGSGAGIVAESSSPTIKRNLIIGNLTDLDGGGILVNGGSAQILSNTIVENTADWGGGVRLINDVAATVIGNEIVNNTGSIYGGGISVECCGAATALIARNHIVHNQSNLSGGGIQIDVTDALLVNNIVARNQASAGSGICLDGLSSFPVSATLLHNTCVGDVVDSIGIGVGDYVAATLTNNIVASHATGITITAAAGTVVIADYTLFDDNETPYGAGVTSNHEVYGEPRFINRAAGDYHLGPGSAAINHGTGAGVYEDIDGETRPFGLAPDIGADEARLRVFIPLVLKNY